MYEKRPSVSYGPETVYRPEVYEKRPSVSYAPGTVYPPEVYEKWPSVSHSLGSPLPPEAYDRRPSVICGPPGSRYAYTASAPPGSFYQEDVPQYFFRWTSPPGLVRILQGLVILLCVTIFACVASTLAWDYNYGGLLGYGSGMGGYYGSSGYYPGSYYGGTNPRAANGFMISMAVLCFLISLGLFVAGLSKSRSTRSRHFYLLVLVVSAILAFFVLIASIVYIFGVNPRASMTAGSGSFYYNQIMMLCAQVYSSPIGGGIMNRYLYHYCMVDPQEAVAIVCGFLIVTLLCVICFFAHKTRYKIWRYGKDNIYWDKPLASPDGPNVDDWVKATAGGTNTQEDVATLAYSEKPTSPLTSPYSAPPEKACEDHITSVPPPAKTGVSSLEEGKTAASHPPTRRGQHRHRRHPELDESQCETDFTTAVESNDERDQNEWVSLYPPITSDEARQTYKTEFDMDLKRYKKLCAAMDDINDQISQLSRQLDDLPEDGPEYQATAEEYNRLKDLKQMPDYQTKKLESKNLRSKLFHIKHMVRDYDKHRG
ncbi:occludin-like [Ornithorhynchus anatinus]|uniref:Occludin n=1 Tax=Ornithorhynchus anatinus TaxID=9258 RepID=A0A6I8PC87_ORNAN|nr:occludin-like [Ornithorhynchus anatinus]XP_039766312.1 occludin-like [Ornithorhynchus anatinus]